MCISFSWFICNIYNITIHSVNNLFCYVSGTDTSEWGSFNLWCDYRCRLFNSFLNHKPCCRGRYTSPATTNSSIPIFKSVTTQWNTLMWAMKQRFRICSCSGMGHSPMAGGISSCDTKQREYGHNFQFLYACLFPRNFLQLTSKGQYASICLHWTTTASSASLYLITFKNR